MKLHANTPFPLSAHLHPAARPPAVGGKTPDPQDDEKAVKAFGVDYGEKMCTALLAAGAPGLHFYTLNLEKVMLKCCFF